MGTYVNNLSQHFFCLINMFLVIGRNWKPKRSNKKNEKFLMNLPIDRAPLNSHALLEHDLLLGNEKSHNENFQIKM